MSQRSGVKTFRKGTNSCVECRRRKIRCIWSTNGDGAGNSSERQVCEPCETTGRKCVPQINRAPTSSVSRLTARDRIGNLEREIASLSALVREQRTTRPDVIEDQLHSDSPSEHGSERVGDIQDVEAASPPSHLRLIFGGLIVGADAGLDTDVKQRLDALLTRFNQEAKRELQQLIPSREEINHIADYAPGWMSMYYALFPACSDIRTRDQLMAAYNEMHDPQVRPVTLASFLLSTAITAQQVPYNLSIRGRKSCGKFVDDVSRVVERTVVANNAVAGTVGGLAVILLFIRLQLGRGNLKSMWLTLRRAIALAELIGLPNAKHNVELAEGNDGSADNSSHENNRENEDAKAELWDAICATDRNAGMMFNLPSGTVSYKFPRNESIIDNGRVSPQAYNYRLSAVCIKIQQLDESYVKGISNIDSYEKVLSADHDLRVLAALPPKTWWTGEERSLTEHMVQFWHHYHVARVHLRPAMMNKPDNQYSYSQSACWQACENVVRRYPVFRRSLPVGFFVCRVVDVQVFTAAVFLLLSSRLPASTQFPPSAEGFSSLGSRTLIQQAIDTLNLVSDQVGADTAREAATALLSLRALVENADQTGESSLTLRIPLLGKIHIGRCETPSASVTKPVVEGEPPVASSGAMHNAQHFNSVYDMDAMNDDIINDTLPWTFEASTSTAWLDDLSALFDQIVESEP